VTTKFTKDIFGLWTTALAPAKGRKRR
jgi:hypothetical protein